MVAQTFKNGFVFKACYIRNTNYHGSICLTLQRDSEIIKVQIRLEGKNSPPCAEAFIAAIAIKFCGFLAVFGLPMLLLLLFTLLRWASFRMDIEGVPTGVALALGGLEIVLVTTCICSPNCFKPI